MSTSTFELNGFSFSITMHHNTEGFYCVITTPHDSGKLESETWPTIREAQIDAAEIALDWSQMLLGLRARLAPNGAAK